jgi:hypothetical protein
MLTLLKCRMAQSKFRPDILICGMKSGDNKVTDNKIAKEVIVHTVSASIAADDKFMRESIYTAIEKAERFNTPLVIKANGQIIEISPADLRKQLSKV